MVSTYNDDFSVTWADPADAELTWLYDPMHMPYPLCPAVTELWDGVYQRYMSARTVYVNGYGYATQPTPAPPTPEIVKRGVFDVWTNDYLPQIRTFCDSVRSANYDALALAALGDEMPAIVDRAVHAYGFTMKPISAFMGPTFGFVAFLEGEIGPEGPQLAATLLQGFENGTAAAGAGLSELADAAAKRPAVVDALKRGDFDGLGAVEGGADFLKQFHTYLDNFGWRVDSWGTLEKPTWAENPRLPLTLIARYMNDPARTPRAAMTRSIAQREEAVRLVESKLNPDRLPAFRSMLEGVQSHVPVSEGRALWQLIITGSTRVPYLALGRRLAEAGSGAGLGPAAGSSACRASQLGHGRARSLLGGSRNGRRARGRVRAIQEPDARSIHRGAPGPDATAAGSRTAGEALLWHGRTPGRRTEDQRTSGKQRRGHRRRAGDQRSLRCGAPPAR